MKKQLIRITESDVIGIVKQIINEIDGTKKGFASDYNTAMDKKLSRGGMWGMELKNPEGEWEYGDVNFNVNNMTMSCMGATIQVDPDMTVDQNLEALYDKLMEIGYYSE